MRITARDLDRIEKAVKSLVTDPVVYVQAEAGKGISVTIEGKTRKTKETVVHYRHFSKDEMRGVKKEILLKQHRVETFNRLQHIIKEKGL